VLCVYWSSDIEQIAVGCMDRIKFTDIDDVAGQKDSRPTSHVQPYHAKINRSTSKVPCELLCLSWLFSPIQFPSSPGLDLPLDILVCISGSLSLDICPACQLSHALLLGRRLWLKINKRNKEQNKHRIYALDVWD
jgi:hypothetical protein